MALNFRQLFPEEFLTALLEDGLREDGRQNHQVRTTTLNTGSLKTANGSSIVRMGRTCVTCGIQAAFSNPHPTAPNDGFIVLDVEYSLVSGTDHTHRYLSPSSLSQTLQDLLINTQFVNLNDLCIQEGQLCWTLHIDVLILSVDGPPLDACVLAVMSALKDVKLPSVNIETGSPQVSMATQTPLKIGPLPLTLSFVTHSKAGTLADPTEEESNLCPGLLTIGITNDSQLAGIFKFGGASLDGKQLQACIKSARKQYNLYIKLISTTITT